MGVNTLNWVRVVKVCDFILLQYFKIFTFSNGDKS